METKIPVEGTMSRSFDRTKALYLTQPYSLLTYLSCFLFCLTNNICLKWISQNTVPAFPLVLKDFTHIILSAVLLDLHILSYNIYISSFLLNKQTCRYSYRLDFKCVHIRKCVTMFLISRNANYIISNLESSKPT